MEIGRFVAVLFLLICSISASNSASTTPPSGGGGSDAHSMPCIQKLMPCQPYLHSATPPPPASCCVPLKEIVEKDVTCLCSVFNNVDMLKSLNLTKENALVLPKACGANADVAQCKNNADSPPSTLPATPTTPPASSSGSSSTGGSSSSTGGSSSSTATPTSSAPTIFFAGVSFASAVVASLFA